jgi:hypothetical protein
MTLTEARKAIHKVLAHHQALYWAREENATTLRDLTPAEETFIASLTMIADRHNARVGSVQRQYGDCSRRHLAEIEASMIDKARDMVAAYETLMNFEMEEA